MLPRLFGPVISWQVTGVNAGSGEIGSDIPFSSLMVPHIVLEEERVLVYLLVLSKNCG